MIINYNLYTLDHNPNRSYESETSRPIGANLSTFRPISERIHIFDLHFCLSDGFMRSSETVPDCLHKVQFPLFSKQFRPNRQHNNQIDRIHAE